MRTEWIVAVALTGCAFTSARGDLDRIASLSHPLSSDVLDAPFLGPSAELDDASEIDAFVAEPLTLDRAVARALEGNRMLRAEVRELGIDRGRLLQASLLPNPTAEIDVRRADDASQPLQLDFYVEMPLTESLLVPLRTAAAGRDLDAARLRTAASVVRTVYEVEAAYHRAEAAEQRWRIATRSLEALAAARDTATMLYDAGNVPALDVATQIAVYQEARLEVAMLELERAERREALNRLLGLSGDATAWTLPLEPAVVPTEVTPSDTLEAQAIEASLELEELRARADASGMRVDLSRLEGWLPDVSVDVHAEADGPGWEIGGGASFTIPSFDHGEGTAAAHEATLEGLIERYEGTAIELRSLARAQRAAVETARLRARHYEDVVLPAWARVVEETRLQYDAMQVGLFELVRALRARFAAELGRTRALEDYLVARAALEALTRGVRVDVGSPSSAPATATPTPGGH